MNMTITNAFLTYTALGYGPQRLLPIIPPGAEISERSSLHKRVGTEQDPRGKTPGVKNRAGLWHSFDWVPYEADEQDLTRWHAMEAGVGIKTGNGLLAIDADTTNADEARIIRDLCELHLGRLPVRVGRYPKALYLCRVSEDYRYTRVDFGPRRPNGTFERRVEILTAGRQFVAHGIHPGTKQPYHWPREIVPFDRLPVFTAAQIDGFMEALRSALPAAGDKLVREGGDLLRPINQESLKGAPEIVAKAVRATPNRSADFPSRESYRDFGYAIKAALTDDEPLAFELFADWCDRWEDGRNDANIVEADWKRMKPPYRRGAGWLYEIAERLAPEHFSPADAWFHELPDAEEEENPFRVQEQNAAKAERAEQSASKFTLIPFEDAARLAVEDVAPPLIKGLLDQGTLSCLYGDSNVGKTFVAMDMAYHVSAGRSYSGLKTERGLVVYVAAEGGRGAKRRLAALRQKFGPNDRPDFVLLPASVDLRNPEIDLNAFKAALASLGRPVVLIVIDTLSRAMAGGDENGSVDMGAFVRNVDAVRAATGAHVMIVHHTGKDKAKGARGHTLLRAALDTELEVAEGLISVTKQRDLDKSWTSAFRLEVRELGRDADGDRITSCTVRLDGVTAERRGEPTEGETAVRAAIEMLSETAHKPEDGARTSDLEAWCKANLDGMTRDALNAHLRGLRQKRLIDQPKRGYWRAIGHSQFDVLDGPECVETASTHSVLGQSVQSESVGMCGQRVGDIFS